MPFVYLVREVPIAGETIAEWTRVGCTKNPPEWRLGANLMRGNPRKLELPAVYVFATEAVAYAAEAATLAHFYPHHGRNDWFRLPWQQIDAWCVAQGYTPRS